MAVRIPVYQPYLHGNETKYVVDCMDTTWISSNGDYIKRFEAGFSEFTGIRNCISVSNGSVALHLALMCLGIGPGDEVLVPTFTYIASVNAIALSGATPVLVESEADSWLMDLDDAARKITPKTKAIMAVHLYGFTIPMEQLSKLAKANDLKIVEDAAEVVGMWVKGRHVGYLSDVATFSFFGNKTLTCGEGGMIVTNDDALAANMRITKNHGMSTTRRYWHDRFGVNYRMTNIQAAIGLAQLEQADTILKLKRAIYQRYRDKLAGLPLQWQIQTEQPSDSNYWLVSCLVPGNETRERLIAALAQAGIETRPVFICAHQMPPYKENDKAYPVAQDISARGISLPSYPALIFDQIDEICRVIKDTVNKGSSYESK